MPITSFVEDNDYGIESKDLSGIGYLNCNVTE